MKNRLTYFILLIPFILWIDSKGIDPPPFTVLTLDNPAPGYLFLDPYSPGFINLVDNSGQPVYIKNLGAPIPMWNLRLQPNGLMTYFAINKFYSMDENFRTIDSFQCIGNYITDFHEIVINPNGHVFLMGLDVDTVDLSKYFPGAQKNVQAIGNVIQELDENHKVVFQWRTFDHYIITDIVDTTNILSIFSFETAHLNSISFDSAGNLIISAHDLDEVTKINKKTGEIMWRFGGKLCKNNQFKIIGDTIDGFWGFSHQHSVVYLPNGNILMYDNGAMRDTPFSRAVEYKINETEKTATRVWQYRSTPDIYTISMGSVQRLSNGNTIIGWGTNDSLLLMTEVHPDNTKAMEINNHCSYSVYRYPIKMASESEYINKTGNFDFNDSLNQTGVSLDIDSAYGSGYLSVERHYYLPYNLMFVSSPLMATYPNRWVLNNKGITKVDGIIRFDLTKITNIDPLQTNIAVRPNEGKGKFMPLETHFNSQDNTLEANIQGFGEFILCNPNRIETPILNYPPNDSITPAITVALGWNPVSTDSRYRCQISKDSSFNMNVLDTENISDPWIICNNLDYETKYFWRVKAISGTKESDWSEVWSFITTVKQVLDAPSLISPLKGMTDVPVSGTLSWSNVYGATYYNIELSANPGFQSSILERNFIFSKTLDYNNLDYNTKYFWHVNSSNDIVSSLWSEIWNFTTEPLTSFADKDIQNVFHVNSAIDNNLFFTLKLEKPCTINLEIYNILGTLVTNMIIDNLETGDNIIRADTRNLNNGIYFYLLTTGDKSYTGKFIFTK
jgi:hypothetical protein